jgi:NTE family protein
MARNQHIGIALGSGAARGFSHIGILKRLAELDVHPDVICGTSAGSLMGAVYCLGKMDEFVSWVTSLSSSDVLRYMDVSLMASGGLADAENLMTYLADNFGDPDIEDLDIPFAAIATDLQTGREIWLREGNLWDAVRASIAIPGLLTPKYIGERWLVDGGLVNPVPVSVCRAMGAERIIAVDLNSDLMRTNARPIEKVAEEPKSDQEPSGFEVFTNKIKSATSSFWSEGEESPAKPPSMVNAIMNSIDIMQDRITRSRMAGEPADVTLMPRLGSLGLLEFSQAMSAVQEGRDCVDRSLSAICYELGLELEPKSPRVEKAETIEADDKVLKEAEGFPDEKADTNNDLNKK